jgi:hypothetical protein
MIGAGIFSLPRTFATATGRFVAQPRTAALRQKRLFAQGGAAANTIYGMMLVLWVISACGETLSARCSE